MWKAILFIGMLPGVVCAQRSTVLSSDGQIACGVPDLPLATSMAAWPPICAGHLRLFVNPAGLSGLDGATFLDAAREACENCSAVSGLKVSLVSDKASADIALAAESLRSGILAYCEFPANTCSQQLQTRFNNRVQWSRPLFLDTLVHELGHGWGLPHTGDKRDIMYPSLISGRGLDGKYGPYYSVPQMVARYGEADKQTPLPLPPVAGGWPALLNWALQIAAMILASYLAGHHVATRGMLRQPPRERQARLPGTGEP